MEHTLLATDDVSLPLRKHVCLYLKQARGAPRVYTAYVELTEPHRNQSKPVETFRQVSIDFDRDREETT